MHTRRDAMPSIVIVRHVCMCCVSVVARLTLTSLRVAQPSPSHSGRKPFRLTRIMSASLFQGTIPFSADSGRLHPAGDDTSHGHPIAACRQEPDNVDADAGGIGAEVSTCATWFPQCLRDVCVCVCVCGALICVCSCECVDLKLLRTCLRRMTCVDSLVSVYPSVVCVLCVR